MIEQINIYAVMENLIRQLIRDIIKESIIIDSLNLSEAKYKGRSVTLNKPMRDDSGKKKFKVYVKNPKTGNVKVIRFGDPNMRIKKNNPKRRKSFRARHKCDTPAGKNKLTARYWSCRKW